MKYCENGVVHRRVTQPSELAYEPKTIMYHGVLRARDASCPTISNAAALLFFLQDFPTAADETKERFCLQQMECPSWRLRPLALSNEALLNCITDSLGGCSERTLKHLICRLIVVSVGSCTSSQHQRIRLLPLSEYSSPIPCPLRGWVMLTSAVPYYCQTVRPMKTKTADGIELLPPPSLCSVGFLRGNENLRMKEATSMRPTNEESLNLRKGTK